MRNYPQHLVDTGKVSTTWAAEVAVLDAAKATDAAIMITPAVIESIAKKR